jgi:hypothetical protein
VGQSVQREARQLHIPPEVSALSKKSIPIKAASAVFAGLLVLGSGIAVAGAESDDSTEPTQVVSDPAGPALVAEPGTDVEDGSGDETAPDGSEGGEVKPDPVDDGDDAVDEKPVVGDDPADGDDTGVIEITDDNDGIVTVGDDRDQGEVKEHPANHGGQVSQVAHQKEVVAGSEARNHGATVSAVAKSKSHGDDDKVKVDDDEDAAKDAAEEAEEAAKEAAEAAKEAPEEAEEAAKEDAEKAKEAADDAPEAAEVDED